MKTLKFKVLMPRKEGYMPHFDFTTITHLHRLIYFRLGVSVFKVSYRTFAKYQVSVIPYYFTCFYSIRFRYDTLKCVIMFYC